MENEKRENASDKLTRFYVEQVERSAPRLKNAVNDWQRLCTGMMDASFKAQKSLMKSMGMENQLVDQFEDIMKSTTQATLKMQKEFSDATIDASLKVAQSFLDKKTEATD